MNMENIENELKSIRKLIEQSMEFDPKEIIRREIILNKERTLALEKINRDNEIHELENKLIKIKQ